MEDEPESRPKAEARIPFNVTQALVKGALEREGMAASPAAAKLLHECLHEFVRFVAAQTAEVAEKQQSKAVLIQVKHVVAALRDLELAQYADQLEQEAAGLGVAAAAAGDKKAEARKRKKAKHASGLSDEELARTQERLFAEARREAQAAEAAEPPA